ncbi:MAG: YkgJ family cysteine cluster protein [Nitrospirota bacterium]|nr:YkgJ family cysteine cluster protein [Nitrospirota bacterium]
MTKSRAFYSKGIKFACQGCGACCAAREHHTYVYLSFGDRKRFAARLKITTAEFTRKYTEASDGFVHLKDPEKDCPFLKDNRCIAHEARPWQCRTWPFWPENMHPKVWERDVAAFCPGIGKGRLYTAEEIDEIMERRMEVKGEGDQSGAAAETDLKKREKPTK